MSKAILVMGMPKKCGECSLRMSMICTPTLKDIDSVNAKMDWCPLREAPKKKGEWIPTVIQDIEVCGRKKDKFVSGYNACIDEIMKGSEENG